MPITLPVSGLTCPELGDDEIQACQWLKDLFVYVENNVAGGGGTGSGSAPADNVCQNVLATSWVSIGDASCRVFKQTITIPSGLDAAKGAFTFRDATGCIVYLDVDVTSSTTLTIETNNPINYTIIYA